MKFSAPIYMLKQQAKALSQRDNLRLHVALDKIASREGFRAWSHLASSWREQNTCSALYDHFCPGDMVLLGARPNQGKTLLGIGLAVEAMSRGKLAAFFTLEFTALEAKRHFQSIGKHITEFSDRLIIDTSDDISSRHIIQKLSDHPPHTLIVVDYLQLLDQRRDKPILDTQVREMKEFARARQAIVICLSQISRDYSANENSFPELRDVRLPNHTDLSLFNKACFLNNGKMRLHTEI